MLALQRCYDNKNVPSAFNFDADFYITIPPYYAAPWAIVDNKFVWDERLIEAFKAGLAASSCPFIVTSIFGDVWSQKAFFDGQDPLDFFLKDEMYPADTREREIVPLSLMQAVAKHDLTGALMWLDFVRTYTDKPIYELLPPPPVNPKGPEGEQMLALSNEHAKRVNEFGLCPPVLRRKFWKLYAMETQWLCDNVGVFTIDPPNNCFDASGFLRHDMEAGDTLHANEKYGDIVLRDLGELLRHHPASIPVR
ncbi:MAG: hypothetical protein WCI94_12535 [Rhodospirillales bacterium]